MLKRELSKARISLQRVNNRTGDAGLKVLKLIIKFSGLKLQRHPNMKSAFLVKLSELNQSKMRSTIAVTLEMSDFN